MKKIGLFPGSFDPFTKGHEAIVHSALRIFDEIIIAIGENTSKKSHFETQKRIQHIQTLFASNPAVSVRVYSQLTVSFCQEVGANHLVRGLRNTNDFNYEQSIAQMNFTLAGIETVFLLTKQEFSAINSTIVREIHKNNGDISLFVTNPDLLV
jgi:pantetheine-phosphate adenylyltransferase